MTEPELAYSAPVRRVPASSNLTACWRLLRDILGFARPRHLELATEELSWGLLPQLSLCGGVVLVLIALTADSARLGPPALQSLFWIGVWIFLLPIALRLVWPFVSRWERIGLLVLATLGLYTDIAPPFSAAPSRSPALRGRSRWDGIAGRAQ